MVIKEAAINDIEELCKLEKHISIKKLEQKINSKEVIILLEDNIIIGWN